MVCLGRHVQRGSRLSDAALLFWPRSFLRRGLLFCIACTTPRKLAPVTQENQSVKHPPRSRPFRCWQSSWQAAPPAASAASPRSPTVVACLCINNSHCQTHLLEQNVGHLVDREHGCCLELHVLLDGQPRRRNALNELCTDTHYYTRKPPVGSPFCSTHFCGGCGRQRRR